MSKRIMAFAAVLLLISASVQAGDRYVVQKFEDQILGGLDPKEEVVADFEAEVLGVNGWGGGWGDARLNPPMWAADPTGNSTGVLELMLDSSAGGSGSHKGAFANSNLNVIIEGDTAHTIKLDVYLPDDFPTDGALQFFTQDRVTWGWQADWISVSTLTVGAWNTLAFDLKKRIDEVGGFDVSTGVQTGVEFFFNDGGTWAGSVYADNITLVGVKKSGGGTLESPEITQAAAVDTVLTAVSGEVLYYHEIEWKNLAGDMGETYNVYMSKSAPITDVDAAGVIRAAKNLPRGDGGSQHWFERIVTVKGIETTRYYAVTATGLNEAIELVETPVRDGISNTGAITSGSMLMRNIPLLDSFKFTLDGNLDEFRQMALTFKSSKLENESAAGPAAEGWPADSQDLNMEAYLVMDSQNFYIGAEITDDHPAFGTVAWEGDGFDVFGQLTDMKSATDRYFGDDAPSNGEGGFRISYATNAGSPEAALQKNGGSPWTDPTGVEHEAAVDDHSYTVEIKVPFSVMNREFGGAFAPASGQQLLMKIDVNDNDGTDDPYYSGSLRTLQNHWGATPGNYNGWLRAEGWTPMLVSNKPTAVESREAAGPYTTALRGNYPNPFNPSTTILYQTAGAGNVKLSVYDVRGRELRVLFSGRQSAGRHEIQWDGRDQNGVSAGSGVYFVKMAADNYQKVRKVLLVK